MAQLVTELSFSASFKDQPEPDFRGGKLFVCVLGTEYSIDYFPYLNSVSKSFDLIDLHSNHAIKPTSLQYSNINRTTEDDEFVFSDSNLPSYIRFQPDLELALDRAAAQTPSGASYMAQYLIVEQPKLSITGLQKQKKADGSTTYVSHKVELTIPINPPEARTIKLSLQDGLIAYLGKAR